MVEAGRSLEDRFQALNQLDAGRRRRIPHIQQLTVTDCGAACLAMVLAYHGKDVRLDEVRSTVDSNRNGTGALDLLNGARRYGMRGRGLSVEIEGLQKLPRGTILFWEFRHFVVFDRMTKNGITIVDPATGRRKVPMDQFRRSFTGAALVLEPAANFRATDQKRANTVWRYLKQILAHSHLLFRIAVVSGLIRVFMLALPIMTGVLVDRVIPRGDYALLQVLAVGVGALVLFNFLASMIRNHVNLHLSTRLEAEMTLNFVGHLVDLPYEFFQSRTTGDLMVRLGSNTQIRDILTSSTLSALLDGSLVSIYLVLLLLASPQLAALTLGLGAARMVLLGVIRRKQKELVSRSLEVESRSQTYQMEMLNGMETLKSLGAEHRAAEHWSNLYVDALNVSLERGRLNAWFDALIGALRMVSPLAILGLGAIEVLSGDLSLGTMLALTALASAFLTPLDSLVNAMTRFQLLSSYLDRIDDVFTTPREQETRTTRPAGRLRGEIRAESVAFRYGPLSPPVVRDVSFNVEPGATLALVGRSGAGKSTLGKLLVGLYRPSSGRILYDGVPLERFDCRSVRAQLGVVTQSPYLFSGSISSNIALANPSLGLDQIIEAAKLAGIHDDILQMPMGYETIVSTGGSSLSGGQRQRIAVARALVHEPRVILLDEATSQLDGVTEAMVRNNLRKHSATQIIIAHRISTIIGADQILVMEAGRVVQVGTHQELLGCDGAYRALVGAQIETDTGVGGHERSVPEASVS